MMKISLPDSRNMGGMKWKCSIVALMNVNHKNGVVSLVNDWHPNLLFLRIGYYFAPQNLSAYS